MTIEERAKAYDEALERAKEIKSKILYSHLSTESCKAVSEYIDTIIPELAESEDERIRKGLIKLLTVASDAYLVESTGIKKDSYLAWLEKQKEKMTAEEYENSELFQLKLKTKYANGYQDGLVQKEQKPEQSEDEREYVKTLKGLVSDFVRDNGGITDVAYYQKICDWLDTRYIEQKPELCDMGRWDEESYNNGIHHVLQNPEAYGLMKQKPAEWSKEDEMMRSIILESLDRLVDYGTIGMQKDWLKSLRPQPHWKPSEKQMEFLLMLANYFECEGCTSNAKTLREIVEQLKKLGVKEEPEYYQHFDPDC